eukprot:1161781-Pelagomonas_calceolata.AAC.3
MSAVPNFKTCLHASNCISPALQVNTGDLLSCSNVCRVANVGKQDNHLGKKNRGEDGCRAASDSTLRACNAVADKHGLCFRIPRLFRDHNRLDASEVFFGGVRGRHKHCYSHAPSTLIGELDSHASLTLTGYAFSG